ncbi:MAG: sulfotransferase [Magnetococcales bacterium]|nr:sulfotransferase [Magnetococcales bacterium]
MNRALERFFVSGLNKSGTTFLQMLLDAHPTISCPSEHHFKTLFESLPKLANKYLQVIDYFDNVTSNQGCRFNKHEFSDHMLRSAFDYLFSFAINSKTTLSGLHDNSIIHNVDLLTAIVPGAKYIFIVRDPRDIGISLWHHNMRVSTKFAESGQTIDATVKILSHRWRDIVGAQLNFQKKYPDFVHIVRYEDLVGKEREAALLGILNFFKMDAAAATIGSMFEKTDFEKLKSKAAKKTTDPGKSFFRTGKKGNWRDTLDGETKLHVVNEARQMLLHFGYSLE